MELILTQQADYQVNVTCDNQLSHTFDLQPLRLLGHWFERIINDPIKYGQLLFQALFPQESKAWQALNAHPERIVLINTDDELDTLPWEYLYGPEGFLVLDVPFVRGLPAEQRIPAPRLDTPLHIVAIPSNPLSHRVEPLNIDTEWQQLIEVIKPLPFDVTLERVRPPTLEQVRRLIASTRQRVIHFMGHGEQVENGSLLYFEQENGDLDPVEAQQFISSIHTTPFLITLNACVSAAPGPTAFSNLAASIVKAKIPYALGMRFRIYDDDALNFSRMLYTELAQGAPIEKALLHVRRLLACRPRTWTIGVPVLYTSLENPADGFVQRAGATHIDEHQPPIDVSSIVRATGTFQGRIEDLIRLGDLLTGGQRPRILTIHGGGGQGKTALARETIERFAYAWPDGIWGTMLDPLPERSQFVNELAQFLGILVQEITNPKDLEDQILRSLGTRRTLLVLDNAETLVHAIENNDPAAIALVEFLQQLPGTATSLLATSRVQLGWTDEIIHELGGLTVHEGALLFQHHAPQRLEDIDREKAQKLSQKVEGHPLGLRLLAGAFNESKLSLHVFIQQYEEQLVHADDTYVGTEHRHRKLYASIDTSIRYLSDDLRDLLSNLWIFQAPFLPEIAISIFDPDTADVSSSRIDTHLKSLWLRGLLARITIITREGTHYLYYLLPTTRPYIQTHLPGNSSQKELFHRYGEAYEEFLSNVYDQVGHSAFAVALVQQMEKDLEQAVHHIAVARQRFYKAHWARILYAQGKLYKARGMLEDVLEQIQGEDQILELEVLTNLVQVYYILGQPQRALTLYEQALPLMHKVGDPYDRAIMFSIMGLTYKSIHQYHHALELSERALPLMREIGNRLGEAATLSNIGSIYRDIGQPQRALSLYEQVFPILRELDDRTSEATTLNYIGNIYTDIGQPQRALTLHEHALPILQELGDRSREATTLSNIGNAYYALGQPQRALEAYEQARLIYHEIGALTGEATILNDIGKVYNALGQPQRALMLYEQALPILRDAHGRPGEVVTLSHMASIYSATGQPQRALELLEQALLSVREVGDRAGEAATLNHSGNVYHALGQLQRALALHEQALPIMREVNNRAGEASVLNNIASLYQATGQPQQALTLYEQALLIDREVGNRSSEATALSNMASAYHVIGQPQHALELYEQALPIRREVGDRSGEATTLSNMASIYRAMSQPQRARALHEQVLPIQREVGDRAGEAATLDHMASAYRDIGQYQHALELYEQALPIRREVGDRSGEAFTLTHTGNIYHDMNQSQRALVLHEQALSIMREVGDRAGEALVLNNMASVYHTTNRPQQALTLYEQALLIDREVGNRSSEATALSNMAGLYHTMDQPQRALELYEQALPMQQDLGDRSGETNILSSMASIYEDIGQPQRALELYEQALPITHKIGDRSDEATTLNNMAKIYHDIGQHPQALSFFEQALFITREISDHSREATTLSNIASVYHVMGQHQRAIAFFERALPIMHEVEDLKGEATTLNSIGLVYRAINQPQQALAHFERALPIMTQIGDHTNEATTLNNAGMMYQTMGQYQRALSFFEQALPIMRKIGNPGGEAITLNNIATAYRASGQPQQALSFLEQTLTITRKVGDRASEATTLNNIGMVYQMRGQYQQALSFLEQALIPTRQVKDRAGEATTLNNIAEIYQIIGQYQHALALYEQALPMRREVEDRNGESITLNHMGRLYQTIGQPQQALAFYEQALSITRKSGNHSGEAATLNNMAFLFYESHEHQSEALHYLQQARQILEQYGLSQDAIGNTISRIDEFQKVIQQSVSSGSSNSQLPAPSSDIHKQMMVNTIAVMTKAPERHKQWRQRVATFLEEAQAKRQGNHREADLYQALLDILDGKTPALSPDHPNASAIAAIQKSITQKKAPPATNIQDEASFLASNRETIVMIISNTLAVLSQAKDQKHEWRAQLTAMRQALSLQPGISDFMVFLDTIITLLDTNGDPTGLGKTLASTYIPIWKELLYQLEAIRQQDY